MANNKRPWKVGQPFHKKTGRPFRGPTPAKIFQTVDLGSGIGDYIIRSARERRGGGKEWRKRQYLGVDPWEKMHSEERHKFGLVIPPNVHFISIALKQQLENMIKRGEKTRHFNWDMPIPITIGFVQVVHEILPLLPRVLLPNGKLFVKTEKHAYISILAKAARAQGFRVNIPKPLIHAHNSETGEIISPRRFTWAMHAFLSPGLDKLYRLEITFTPKTARRFAREQKKNKNLP